MDPLLGFDGSAYAYGIYMLQDGTKSRFTIAGNNPPRTTLV